jgi:transcriptional enhancer factor
MRLVSDPVENEDVFAPSEPLYFDAQSPTSSPMGGSYRDTHVLMAPYDPSFYGGPSTGSSQQLSGRGPPPSPYGQKTPVLTPTSALRDMHLTPHNHQLQPEMSPIVLTNFCMWAASSTSPEQHVYAKLDHQMSHFPRSTTFAEDLFEYETRLPNLVAMHERLPCQFLHVKLPVCMPGNEGATVLDSLNAQLSLASVQDWPLSAVTSIYSYGTRVLHLVEPLPPAVFLGHAWQPNAAVPPLSAPGSSSASGSEPSPLTPNSQPGLWSARASPQHRFSYACPFASEFFSIFLRGALSGDSAAEGLPSFRKDAEERADMDVALRGITVMQEFVVPWDEFRTTVRDAAGAGEAGTTSKAGNVSPGSAIGDVVLLVVYEFEGTEWQGVGGAVTSLSTRANTIPVSSFGIPASMSPPTTASSYPPVQRHSHGGGDPSPEWQLSEAPTSRPGARRSTTNKLNLSVDIASTQVMAPEHALLSASDTGAPLMTPWS